MYPLCFLERMQVYLFQFVVSCPVCLPEWWTRTKSGRELQSKLAAIHKYIRCAGYGGLGTFTQKLLGIQVDMEADMSPCLYGKPVDN